MSASIAKNGIFLLNTSKTVEELDKYISIDFKEYIGLEGEWEKYKGTITVKKSAILMFFIKIKYMVCRC